ncbi:MAG: hypothetical protein GY716_20655 [bacterium]|nr:hypothetical protein [bacterium]
MRRTPRPTSIAAASMSLLLLLVPARASDLETDLGRSEVRVRSAPHMLVAGRSVADSGLIEHLERLSYERVKARPESPGQFFYGHDVFWIYRRAHRWDGRDHGASLIGLALRRADGMILGARGVNEKTYALDREGLLWLEPETLAESLDARRAPRAPVALDELPEHVWQALLAAEDARFFGHMGLDARSIARAAAANVKRGGVAQGGSTITQQLIKNRDLTPKRTLGRKLSEAARALALEARYDKREILQAYLNHVYYGHVGGLSIYGIGAAAQAYYSKPASRLTLAEAAMLAALVQGPNGLAPQRHPERARERRDWVLSRLSELEWVDDAALHEARRADLGVRPSAPRSTVAGPFIGHVAAAVERDAGDKIKQGRGVVVETTLDARLQAVAERTVRRHLEALRRDYPRLRELPLSAALVAVDAGSGAVRAWVGGDPADADDRFDRVARAVRQPGSAIKPLILLEAFEACGGRRPLHPASRVADEPLRIDLPSGPWEPQNIDRRFEGVVDLRRALAESRNVPLVRVARWCGFEATARRMRALGIDLPDPAPPAYALGAVEISPLRLAQAYTAFAEPLGKTSRPFSVRRIERPGGRQLSRTRDRRRRGVRASTAYLVRHVMTTAVEAGTASGADLGEVDVAAKTGTSSEKRDAWLAGHAGRLVTVVWVGLDEGRLGLTGSVAAGPLWRAFMREAVGEDGRRVERPREVVERHVDTTTGLLVREFNADSRPELFRRGALPERDRFWRVDQAIPVVR